VVVDGREMLAFCSNDYLGLANAPARSKLALQEGAAIYGAGSGASHLISGHAARTRCWKSGWPNSSVPIWNRHAR
jgi:7-keto-8-aminopelargonate synthetase-like enzyme